MTVLPLRAVILGAILATMPFANIAAGRAPEADKSDQQRIAQAIQAYARTQQAEADKVRDQLVSANATALLQDPRTPAIGDAQADVRIVEFLDYTCPYCKAAEPRVEQLLKTDRRVKLLVKEFPILTPESLIGAKAALAAARQGKYRQFHQALMGFKGPLQAQAIFETAKDVGLDVDRLRKDMEAPEIADEIIANFNLARAIRIFQTPAFIVNDHFLTGPSAEIDFPKVVAAARAKGASSQ